MKTGNKIRTGYLEKSNEGDKVKSVYEKVLWFDSDPETIFTEIIYAIEKPWREAFTWPFCENRLGMITNINSGRAFNRDQIKWSNLTLMKIQVK